MKKLKFITLIILTTFIGKAFSQESFYPSNILMMDEKFTHHVILVEKGPHKLHIYENSGSFPKLVKTFNMATGKFKGDKSVNGDHKTPEGIYTIYDFLSKEELFRRHGDYAKIYGPGAFPMDYPNFMDHRAGKTGGGIWLHSTDNDDRIQKGLDSRGCVVLQANDLKEVSQFIDISNTPIVVVQDSFFLSKNSWENTRKEISTSVNKWIKAWQEKDFDGYITSYDQKIFYDKSKGNYNSYKAYKKAVFSRPDKPEIKLEYVSILLTDPSEQYAVVQLQQDYRSMVINDIGKKVLYLKKDENYDWKIVGELWTKIEGQNVAFTPAKRFFKD